MAPEVPDDAKCLHCGYPLRGLPRSVCPECGRPFDPADARTYRTPPAKPPRRLTPLSLAGATLVAYAGCLLALGALDPGTLKGTVSMSLQPVLMTVATALALFATAWAYRTRRRRAETTLIAVILLAIIFTIHLPSYIGCLHEIARLQSYSPQPAPTP